ncbi:STY4528 family pathogenicity island replication protein [Pseudomonas putida]|uniref:STY4528 family pathogenicity island replication protein n=1 Tax=Pseudomonas putida TaxID=303 RepID=UPI0023644480|nr:STY4528 family pathogenicity island replication protein [Pseudomonas putida]MDD2052750.1 STY4528 family pathogenicity island replication protein [Pseudomonas putida]
MSNLEAMIGRACGQLVQRANEREAGTRDDGLGGLLFFGNAMEATPRRLLLDKQLSPVDKVGWMAFRMLASQDRETSFPSYDDLQQLLSGQAGRSSASRGTVNRVVFILRLTRWLTLCHRARNTRNGRMIGNLYALHDEPCSIADTVSLDLNYVSFVSKCKSHAHQAVRKTAEAVFQTLKSDPKALYLINQLELFEQRLGDHALKKKPRKRTPQPKHRARPDENRTGTLAQSSNLKNRANENRTRENRPQFDFRKDTEKPPESPGFTEPPTDLGSPAPGTVRTLLTDVSKSVRTTRGREAPLDWSELPLNPAERAAIERQLCTLDPELRQPLLDEAVARKSGIRNLSAYLMGLIGKAKRGELKITQSTAAQGSPGTTCKPPPAPPKAPDRPKQAGTIDVAAQLRAIHQLLGRATPEKSHNSGEKTP